jgi:transcriptional regulator with XRE-family HTH domain
VKVSERIKKIRHSLGLTQREFCRLYNRTKPRSLTIKQSLLSRYERGDVTPPADKYSKILDLAA